jgi:capsular exopolysaccharide synthesis family protein
VKKELDFFDGEPQRSEGLSIDVKRIFYKAIQYWYVIVLTLAIALVLAFLKNRYSTRIYPVTASILIKESEASEGKLLYNNPLVAFSRNYLNELYIIKSYPLIQSVIEDLNFDFTFYKEGNVKTTEVYEHFPVSVEVVETAETDYASFNFKIIGRNEFTLSERNESENSEKVLSTYRFNDTIRYNGLALIFTPKDVKALEELKDQSFIAAYTSAKTIANDYVGRLSADWSEEGAGVIDLSINGPSQNKEIDFLNGLIRRYQNLDLQRKNTSASRTIEFITEQLDGISDSLAAAEQQLELFKDKNVVTDLSAEALRLYKKLEELEVQKTELTLKNNYYKYLTDYIQSDDELGQVILPSSVGIEDQVLSSLISTMVELQLNMKLMLDQEKLQNPLVDANRKRIRALRSDIAEAVNNQRSIDKIRLDLLNKNIRYAESQLDYLPKAERRLVSIKRNYTLLDNLYVFLLQKKAEAGISKASTMSDVSIVNPPMLAGGPISPNTKMNFLIFGFAGLAFPFLGFVLVELFNTRVQSKEDIERITTIPFVGGIGHKKDLDNKAVLSSPKSAIAESFRALRSNLAYFTGNKDKTIFVITSSISGEGKTFTSINLASVFALAGKRTLIVGADLRKPKLHPDFALHNSAGLSTYLAGLADFDQIVQSTAYAQLDLISGGPVPPNPSELLLSKAMEEFIAEARRRYDCIIIDTPPLAIVTDAFSVTPYADHTVFLVRQNYTPKDLLKTAHEFHVSGKLKNISLLLNDIYKSGPGYGYGYGYTYGYGYGYTSGKAGSGYYQ